MYVRVIGAAAAMAVVFAVGTACTGSTPGSTNDTGLAKYYDQHITWSPCSGFTPDGPQLGPDIECARVLVPIDYDLPSGPTAQVAISRHRARGDRIGSVVLNPGGPGTLGLRTATLGAKALGDRFDVVGFDPRGSGASTPRIQCLTPEENAAMRPDDIETDWTPAGVDATERNNRDYVAKCIQRTGTQLLGRLGTRETARDLDLIRAVLGDPKLTYVGYSYGTRLGAAYAQAFPDRVRAMVLDSGEPLDGPVIDMAKYYGSMQRAFDAYAADCARHRDCPVGTDPRQATRVLHTILRPLLTRPVPAGDRPLTAGEALQGVLDGLYSPSGWPGITTGLRQLRSGHGDALRATVERFDTTEDLTLENATLCLDGPRIPNRAEVATQQQRIFAAAPFLAIGGFHGQAPLDRCAFWPAPPTSTPHTFDVSNLPPFVVVAATDDPAATYDGNRLLANQLHSPLITHHGKQHGVFLVGDAPCVDAPVLHYLTTLTPPPGGIDCR
ncbi:alpha/beta fold hydrolase [Pseudonocardia acaciae]|uniref:alpha/beta fold hydrolase n=1 Tax=Pseudonocardia acaciae TaxID=551276 RepID=UPI00048BC64A|nr:alpha/beta fold hydrolase [Pseudonocardia acaciae]